MRIKMLTQVGDYLKDSVVPVEDAVGKRYIAAGFAEEAPPEDPTEKFLAIMQKQNANVAATAAAEVVALYESKSHDPKHPSRVRIYAGDQEADKTKALGDFLQCVGIVGVLNDPRRALAIERLEKVYGSPLQADFAERFAKAEANRTGISVKAALAESSGITGGYTVPPEYSNRLFEIAAEDTVLVGKTDEYAMTGRELVFPILDQTTAPTAGNTSYFGGVVAYWTAEAATRSETEPKFKERRLVANELSGYALASRNVVMDNAVALEQRLTKLFGGAIGWYRDFAYLQGDGVGKPKGILNEGCTLSVTRATANQVNYADAVSMYGKLLPQSVKNAFWVMQQSVLQSFLQMKDASSRLVIQPYFPGAQGGPAAVRPVMTLLGLPILTTEKVPTLGTKGDVMLIDPTFYFTATRQDVEIAASEHYKFLNNQITYRFLFRGDGRGWLDLPFTLQDTTTQISPFVVLN